eukprot:COSAG05_NODE_9719_length_606_cov_1.238659_1_plen_91_part_00
MRVCLLLLYRSGSSFTGGVCWGAEGTLVELTFQVVFRSLYHGGLGHPSVPSSVPSIGGVWALRGTQSPLSLFLSLSLSLSNDPAPTETYT